MALAFAHLTTDIDDANLTTYTTASFTSTNGRPLFVGVLIADTNPAGTPTLTKTGVTLASLGSIEFDAAGTRRTIFLFHAVPASTSTGTMTITATEAISGCGWTAFECTGHDAADVIEGVAVTNSGSGTAIAATLSAFADTDNAAMAVMAVDVDGSFTTDFTIIGQDQSAGASPVQCIGSIWKANDTTVTATGPSGLWGIVAVEVRAATGADVTGAVALSGTGSLTAAGTREVLGVTALSGAGTLTSAGSHAAFGAAALTGTGSSTTAGTHTGLGAAALTGTGSQTAAGVREVLGAAALTGVGSQTAAATHGGLGAAALTGTGSLTATGGLVISGEAALSGVGSLTAVGFAHYAHLTPMHGYGNEHFHMVPFDKGAGLGARRDRYAGRR